MVLIFLWFPVLSVSFSGFQDRPKGSLIDNTDTFISHNLFSALTSLCWLTSEYLLSSAFYDIGCSQEDLLRATDNRMDDELKSGNPCCLCDDDDDIFFSLIVSFLFSYAYLITNPRDSEYANSSRLNLLIKEVS